MLVMKMEQRPGVAATNGTISVVLSELPTRTTPVLSDFAFTKSVNGSTAETLTAGGFSRDASGFSRDAVTRMASFTFTPVAQTAAAQSVVVGASYKGGPTLSAAAFTVPATGVALAGNVLTWGYNVDGQLGDGTSVHHYSPAHISVRISATAVVAGSYHSVALSTDGTVWTWGKGRSGELGRLTNTLDPGQVAGIDEVQMISARRDVTLVLKRDSTVWGWGRNTYFQLGDGTTAYRSTPVRIPGFSGVQAISPGFRHALALKYDGTVWAWGKNSYGQIGDGTQTDRPSPVQVPGLSGVQAIAAGGAHSLAVKNDGTVWAWGSNTRGEIGDGTTVDRLIPTQVPGLTGVQSVAASLIHRSFAVRNDGTVWAWGENNEGELGDGTLTTRYAPVAISGITGVRSLFAGDTHTLALKSDGTVWSWGPNRYMQLGHGDDGVICPIPTQVPGLSGVLSVSAGDADSLVIVSSEQGATLPSATVSSATASNGSIRVAVIAAPGTVPLLSDFAFTKWVNRPVNRGPAETLTAGGFSWDATTRTASFTFTPMTQAAAAQSVGVGVSYRGGVVVVAYFTVPANVGP
jgi:hypothetical protein